MQTTESPAPAVAPATITVLPTPTSRRRTGKVAALPADIRQFINQSLDDGLKYKDIAAAVTAKGHPIAGNNIGSWARGGYRDYLREEAHKAAMRDQTDKIISLAMALNDDSRAAIEKVSSAIIAFKLIHAIRDFDADALRAKLVEKPELFFRAARVVNAQSLDFSRLRKVELEAKKYDDKTAEQRRVEELRKNPTPGGLSDEALRLIDEAMSRL